MTLINFHESCRRLAGDEDRQLGSYIITTRALMQLADFESRQGLAVGLKGIGKSTSFRYLTEFEGKAHVVVAINPDSYDINLPARNLNFAACRKQFEHDLVIEALRAVIQEKKTVEKICGRDLLRIAEGHVNSYLASLKEAAGRIRGVGVSILGCGFTVQRAESPTLLGLVPRAEVDEARKNLARLCDKGVKIRVVVDDPELVFSSTRDIDAHMIGGLCLATLRLSAEIKNLKALVFLKSHVYLPMRESIEDLSKHPDHMVRLSWGRPELRELVGKRLSSASIGWADLFVAKSANDAEAKLDQMVAMVRNGPRDLLRWLDLALTLSKEKKLRPEDLAATQIRCSQDALNELESAHSEFYPQIGKVLEVIFRSHAEREFTLKEIQEHIKNLLITDQDMKILSGLPWMQRESSKTLPILLLNVGSLAIRVGSELVLPYEEGYDQGKLDSASKVSLVPCLRPAISL
jgi:hypothetical protein